MKAKQSDNQSTAARLRLARERAGFKTAADALERFGWKQSTYLAHENGQNGIRPDKAKLYADAFKVSVGWLLSGEDSAPSAAPPPATPATPLGMIVEFEGTEFAKIPVYDVRFSAGYGANNDAEPVIGYQVMSVETLRQWTDAPLQQLSVIRVHGDSMEPLLCNDDWVLIDASHTNLVSPAVYAIVYDGEGFLKHASKNIETGAVTLVSHNAAYPPQTITMPDRLRIIGRVVLSIRKH